MSRGKSFHWNGSYLENLNEAQTLKTELNVFETFAPKIPAAYETANSFSWRTSIRCCRPMCGGRCPE